MRKLIKQLKLNQNMIQTIMIYSKIMMQINIKKLNKYNNPNNLNFDRNSMKFNIVK